MRFYLPFVLAAFLTTTHTILRADEHGGDGEEYQYSNSNSDFEFGSYGAGSAGPANEDPFYVPSEVRDLFEDAAMRTAAEARARAEKEKEDTTTVLLEKKTVRTLSAPTRALPVASGSVNPSSNGFQNRAVPGATASINQTVTPAVIVNNIIAAREEKEFEDKTLSKEERERQAGTKAFKPLWLEAQPSSKSDKMVVINSRPGNGTLAGNWTGNWIDKLRSWWFERDHALKTSSKGATRRLIVTAEEEIPSFDEPAPTRAISQEHHELTSSHSWFGWIGWIVALMLLGLLLVRTKRELV